MLAKHDEPRGRERKRVFLATPKKPTTEEIVQAARITAVVQAGMEGGDGGIGGSASATTAVPFRTLDPVPVIPAGHNDAMYGNTEVTGSSEEAEAMWKEWYVRAAAWWECVHGISRRDDTLGGLRLSRSVTAALQLVIHHKHSDSRSGNHGHTYRYNSTNHTHHMGRTHRGGYYGGGRSYAYSPSGNPHGHQQGRGRGRGHTSTFTSL